MCLDLTAWTNTLTLLTLSISHICFEEVVIPSQTLINQWKKSFDKESCFDVLEWIGLTLAHQWQAWTINKDPFISVMKAPDLYINHSITHYRIQRGMFGKKETDSILKDLQDTLREKCLPWIAVVFHGFRNVPTLDDSKSHHQDVIAFLCPEGDYVTFQCAASF
jgi:hypothetical protein